MMDFLWIPAILPQSQVMNGVLVGSGWPPVIRHLTTNKSFSVLVLNPDSAQVWSAGICVESGAAGDVAPLTSGERKQKTSWGAGSSLASPSSQWQGSLPQHNHTLLLLTSQPWRFLFLRLSEEEKCHQAVPARCKSGPDNREQLRN